MILQLILRAGDRGDQVATLQKQLNAAGYPVEVSHLYDEETEKAVQAFQMARGLVDDGIAGPKTLGALRGAPNAKHLSTADLAKAADLLGVPLASVRAVNEVESRGLGMLPDGRPVILFERHVFWDRLKVHGIDPAAQVAAPRNILSQTPGGYAGGAAEYVRLASAAQIHWAAAVEATSWGAFQIMGHHWDDLAYPDLPSFMEAMERSEADQLEAFVRFIQADPALLAALKGRKWAAFAKIYNGPNYAKNLYDAKLAQAYAKYAPPAKAAA